MIIAAFLGLFLGFITAIPVAGPVSGVVFAMCFREKYSQARRLALGAGLVEGAYAYLAFWSFNRFLMDLKLIHQISNGIAAFLLSALAIYFFVSKKLRQIPPPHNPNSILSKKNSFLLGAGLSLVNPTLIVTWSAGVAILNSLHLFEFSLLNFAVFSIGASAGITLWFIWMVQLLSRHKKRLNAMWIDRGLKILGVLMFAIAVSIIFKS